MLLKTSLLVLKMTVYKPIYKLILIQKYLLVIHE